MFKLPFLLGVVALAMAITQYQEDILLLFNLEGLSSNPEAREVVFCCLLDETKCPDNFIVEETDCPLDLSEIRQAIIDAVKNQCDDCSPDLKAKYCEFMERFETKYPDVYKAFMEKIKDEE